MGLSSQWCLPLFVHPKLTLGNTVCVNSHRRLRTQQSSTSLRSAHVSPDSHSWSVLGCTFAILLAQSKPLPFLLQFLRHLNVELKCHSFFFHFQKNSYWYDSRSLCLFLKFSSDWHFFSWSPVISFLGQWLKGHRAFNLFFPMYLRQNWKFSLSKEWLYWLLTSIFS